MTLSFGMNAKLNCVLAKKKTAIMQTETILGSKLMVEYFMFVSFQFIFPEIDDNWSKFHLNEI